MVRPLRIHLPGGCYHVTLRGNHQQDIFSVESDRLLLNAIVKEGLQRYDVEIHAYCWMTNHLHLLVRVGQTPLGDFVRHVAAGYARAFQRRLDTSGHLFERRYHATLVDTDSYLLELVRYVHLNPVRAGLVSAAHSYRWSSHHAYVGNPVDPWVTTSLASPLFAATPERAIAAYMRFLESASPSGQHALERLLDARTTVLGGEDFMTRVMGAIPGAPDEALRRLVSAASERFDVPERQLQARVRNPRVAFARAWIAREARARNLATLAEVARYLRCDPRALRHSMDRFAQELRAAG